MSEFVIVINIDFLSAVCFIVDIKNKPELGFALIKIGFFKGNLILEVSHNNQ